MLTIPIFLFGIMNAVIVSAIPIIITLFFVRKIVKSGKKLTKSFTN